MTENEVKAEFGQIILESYHLDEIKVWTKSTEALTELYDFYRNEAHKVINETDITYLAEFDPLAYYELWAMATEFIEWWGNLDC